MGCHVSLGTFGRVECGRFWPAKNHSISLYWGQPRFSPRSVGNASYRKMGHDFSRAPAQAFAHVHTLSKFGLRRAVNLILLLYMHDEA